MGPQDGWAPDTSWRSIHRDVSRRVSDERLGDRQLPWGNEKVPASGTGVIPCLERYKCKVPPLGHESGKNWAREQEKSWLAGNPGIAEVGRDPRRPQVTSPPGAKSQQETQDFIEWSCHCPWGWGSLSTQTDPAGSLEDSQDAGHPLSYSCV